MVHICHYVLFVFLSNLYWRAIIMDLSGKGENCIFKEKPSVSEDEEMTVD